MVGSFAAGLLVMATTVQAQALPAPRPIDPQIVDPITVAPLVRLPEPPEPPDGTDAWTLQISYTGGFTGLGLGTVTVVSDGKMTCDGRGPCAPALTAPQLRQLATTLSSVLEAAWIRRTPTGICSDCMETTIVLKRRGADGVRRLVASWDDSQPIAPELRELRRMVFEMRAASTR